MPHDNELNMKPNDDDDDDDELKTKMLSTQMKTRIWREWMDGWPGRRTTTPQMISGQERANLKPKKPNKSNLYPKEQSHLLWKRVVIVRLLGISDCQKKNDPKWRPAKTTWCRREEREAHFLMIWTGFPPDWLVGWMDGGWSTQSLFGYGRCYDGSQ